MRLRREVHCGEGALDPVRKPGHISGPFLASSASRRWEFVLILVKEGRKEWNRVEKLGHRWFFEIFVNGASKIRQTTSPGMRPSVRPPQFRLGFSYKYINIWSTFCIVGCYT